MASQSQNTSTATEELDRAFLSSGFGAGTVGTQPKCSVPRGDEAFLLATQLAGVTRLTAFGNNKRKCIQSTWHCPLWLTETFSVGFFAKVPGAAMSTSAMSTRIEP